MTQSQNGRAVDCEMLRHFHAATEIPLQIFDDSGFVAAFDVQIFKSNPALAILEDSLKSGEPVFFDVFDEVMYCGAVRVCGSDEYIVAGPVFSEKCSGFHTEKILELLGKPTSEKYELLRRICEVRPCELKQFCACLMFLDYELNGASGHTAVQIRRSSERIASPPDDSIFYIEHLGNHTERELISCVEYGRPEELEQKFAGMQMKADAVPVIAPDSTRSYKNILMMSAGIVSRAALRGGLGYDMMTVVISEYMQKIEAANSNEVLFSFFKQMYVDFARKVAGISRPAPDSIIVTRIVKEIHACLYEKVTPTFIAERLGMSCSYLCRHFKQETGKTISQYVNEVKVQECKRLLDSTDMSVVRISTVLGFSSQNYMHGIFRRMAGVTPAEYRKSIRNPATMPENERNDGTDENS